MRKKPNRKRIALAKEALESFDPQQKEAVLQSIRLYYPSIIYNDNSFKIETEDDLTYLLYGILQRYYTTADGRENALQVLFAAFLCENLIYRGYLAQRL